MSFYSLFLMSFQSFGHFLSAFQKIVDQISSIKFKAILCKIASGITKAIETKDQGRRDNKGLISSRTEIQSICKNFGMNQSNFRTSL